MNPYYLISRAIPILSIVQAAVLIALVLGQLPNPTNLSGDRAFNVVNLFDAATLVGLGVGMLQGRLWSAWGLFVYTLATGIAKMVLLGNESIAYSTLLIIAYGVGAAALHHCSHKAPRITDLRWTSVASFAALLVVGNVIGTYAVVILHLYNFPVHLDSILKVLWPTVVFSLATRAEVPWGLESSLLICAMIIPFSAFDILTHASQVRDLTSIGMHMYNTSRFLLACAVIGWVVSSGLLRLLPQEYSRV